MGMADIRILGNIQALGRQLLPHHNNRFTNNILSIIKPRQSSLRNHSKRAKVKGTLYINR